MIVSNYPPTRYITDSARRKKLLRAVVYDFLKKKHALKLYLDCYIFYNKMTTKEIENIVKKEHKPIMDYCLDKAIDTLVETGESFNDFFFSDRVSFNWSSIGEENKKKIEQLDNDWLSLLGKLRDLR